MMRKSVGELPVTMIVNLVAGLIILGTILWVLAMVPSIADSILKWQQFFSGELDYADDLISAVECSYMRCKSGCDSVAGINVGQDNCKEVFCDVYAINDKVCDENAQLHPVELKTTIGDRRLELQNLEFLDCYDDSACCMSVQSDFARVSNYYTIVWIEHSLVNEVLVPKNCIPKALSMPGCTNNLKENCGADRITVSGGKYYIWTLSKEGSLALGSEIGSTIIWDKPYCPKCVEGKLNEYGEGKFLSGDETCLESSYSCSIECGSACSTDAECQNLGLGDICNLATCECELSIEYYCCYSGALTIDDTCDNGFRYGDSRCETQTYCENIGGTTTPFNQNPVECSGLNYVCPKC